jgi:hypothetical protein
MQTTQSQERQQKPGEGDSTSKIQELEHRLAQIQSEHAEYRKQVEEILEKRWEENEPTSQNTVEHTKAGSDKDKDYFDSYSYSGKLPIYHTSGLTDKQRHSRDDAQGYSAN